MQFLLDAHLDISEIIKDTLMSLLSVLVVTSSPDYCTMMTTSGQVCYLYIRSRNLLSTLPPCICELELLEVLFASHNRLVSLPEEIGQLTQLMELVWLHSLVRPVLLILSFIFFN